MEKKYTKTALASVFIIVVTQVIIGFIIYKTLPDWPTRGQFGDVFGAVNALFSGLAFAGVIYAILLQRDDLALQRKELELTRIELNRSAKAQEQSEAALKEQAISAAKSARLATINFLLQHYREELLPLRNMSFPKGSSKREEFEELSRRELVLIGKIDLLFNDVTE